MKKMIKLTAICLVTFLILEFLFFVLKTNHETTYKINQKEGIYKVKEIYENGMYYMKITFKNNDFALEIPNNFNKRKKIIDKIYIYGIKNDNTLCIYPALKNQDINSNIICNNEDNISSYNYNKDKLEPFVKQLIKKGYYHNSWSDESNKQQKYDRVSSYPNNIGENLYLYLYKYNGFYQITNKGIKEVKLFVSDSYYNPLGFSIGKYYTIPDYDEKYEYTKLYRIDMVKNKIKTINLKKSISKDSYVNGIVNDEAYVFDKDELIQYKINPKKKKVTEIGNKEDKVLIYKLKFYRTSVYNLRDKEVKFKTVDDYIKKLEKTKNINYITKNNDSYYYQLDNDNLYYYNNITKVKVLILHKSISDLKMVNNTLYFISDDTMYSYSQKEGLSKLIKYKELSFNPENRIAIYEK